MAYNCIYNLPNAGMVSYASSKRILYARSIPVAIAYNMPTYERGDNIRYFNGTIVRILKYSGTILSTACTCMCQVQQQLRYRHDNGNHVHVVQIRNENLYCFLLYMLIRYCLQLGPGAMLGQFNGINQFLLGQVQ